MKVGKTRLVNLPDDGLLGGVRLHVLRDCGDVGAEVLIVFQETLRPGMQVVFRSLKRVLLILCLCHLLAELPLLDASLVERGSGSRLHGVLVNGFESDHARDDVPGYREDGFGQTHASCLRRLDMLG